MRVKKAFKYIICLIVNLSLEQFSWAIKPIILDEQKEVITIGEYVEFFEDVNGKYNIDEISNETFASSFKLSRSEKPNFGFTFAESFLMPEESAYSIAAPGSRIGIISFSSPS